MIEVEQVFLQTQAKNVNTMAAYRKVPGLMVQILKLIRYRTGSQANSLKTA